MTPPLSDSYPTLLLPFPVHSLSRLSAGVLLSEGNRSSSLRSHNDRSLGPAFQDRRDSNGNEKPPSHTGGDWRVPEDGHNSGRAGSRADRGRCQLSGRPLVYLCALCSSLCSILLGYDVGVMSGAKEFIKPNLDLSDVQVVRQLLLWT